MTQTSDLTPASPAIGFDAFILAAVASELRHTLAGTHIQKIQQPSASELILSAYGSGGARRVLLSADPRQFRAHLATIRRENPLSPPMFCQVCRKYLSGALVEEVVLPHLDRVLHLVFTGKDGERLRLVVELMGRNSNIALVSGTGTVRAAIRPTPADAPRSLRPGIAYADPPGFGERVDPLTLRDLADPRLADCPDEPKAAAEWLTRSFSGIGKFAAGEILARASEAGGIPSALLALMNAIRTEQFEPFSVVDSEGITSGVWCFEPLTVPAGQRFPRESMSLALETFSTTLHQRTDEAEERKLLARSLAKEVQYRRKEREAALATLAEAAKANRYEELANNLLAALFRVERGMSSVRVPDLYSASGEEVEIALDPRKLPQENAESYFQRARKAREAGAYADGKLADLEAELVQLAQLTHRLEQAEGEEALATLRAELLGLVGADRVESGTASGKKARPRPTERPFGGYRIRTFTIDGFTLLVGDSAEANDYLTTRIASPSDIWFHVRAAPGAHGILRAQGQPGRVPQTVLVRAAEIVAARSATEKHSEIVPVDFVEKRYVRKPRGAKPGQVTYERERTLDVTPRL